MARHNFDMEDDKHQQHSKGHSHGKSGVRVGKFPLALIGLVIVALLVSTITVSVFYADRDRRVRELESNQTAAPTGTTKPTPAPPTTGTAAPGVTTTAATTTKAPETPEQKQRYRLKTGIVTPTNYKVELRVHLPFNASEEVDYERIWSAKPNTVRGNVKINLNVIATTRTIQLHSKVSTTTTGRLEKFNETDVKLTVGTENRVISKVEFDEETDIVTITLAIDLAAGTVNATLDITFMSYIATGAPNGGPENQALYRSSYKVDNNQTRYLAASQFQPYKARRLFPCWDEPGFKSTFETILETDVRFILVRTNGMQTSNVTQQDPRWIRRTFQRTPTMSVYLNAFLISDFVMEGGVNMDNDSFVNDTTKVLYGTIARPELIAKGHGDFAQALGKQMLYAMHANFSVRYAEAWSESVNADGSIIPGTTKLDQAAIPDFSSGAMENWGLVLYREANLLYAPNISSADNKRRIGAVIGHELAHMVFGNLLTCNWWADTWLNEGFASYFEYELMKFAQPTEQWDVGQMFPYWETRAAMEPDSYENAHALYWPNTFTPAEVDVMFDSITYAKGAAVIQMFRSVMGTEKFYSALKKYVHENKNKNVEHKQLLDKLGAEINQDLTGLFDGWVKQSGYPVVRLTLDNKDVKVKQKRFLLAESARSKSTRIDTKWNIPLTITTSAEQDVKTDPARVCWVLTDLEENSSWNNKCRIAPGHNLNIPDGNQTYIIGNIEQYGYYRVNYDNDMWQRIAAQLERNHSRINVINRAQLIDDAMNLARLPKNDSERVEYVTALGLTNYLTEELEATPWLAAADNLRYIEEQLAGSPDYGSVRTYLRRLSSSYQDSFWNESEIWTDNTNETYTQVIRRNVLIDYACRYGNTSCLDAARNAFTAWVGAAEPDETFGGRPNTKDYMLCYGLQQSTDDEQWYKVRDWMISETSSTVKLSYIQALACTTKDYLIQRLLEDTRDASVIGKEDGYYVYNALARNVQGQQLAWNDIREPGLANWNALGRKTNVISGLVQKFKSPLRLGEVRELWARIQSNSTPADAAAVKRSFDNAIIKIQANIEWLKDHYDTVAKYFQDSNNAATATPGTTTSTTQSSTSTSTATSTQSSTESSTATSTSTQSTSPSTETTSTASTTPSTESTSTASTSPSTETTSFSTETTSTVSTTPSTESTSTASTSPSTETTSPNTETTSPNTESTSIATEQPPPPNRIREAAFANLRVDMI